MLKTVLAALSVLSMASLGAAQTDEVVTRGAALGDSPVVAVTDVLADVDTYVDTTVTVEGTVRKVCPMKGCWMELVPDGAAEDARGVRVTFKDYGFFVPTDSSGRQARLEGRFETHELSKAHVDHLIAEGASLTRNADGTATEVSFVAAGVELR